MLFRTKLYTEQYPSAVLDLRFSPHHSCRDIFAVVSSTATVSLYRVVYGSAARLRHLRMLDIVSMSKGAVAPKPGSEIIFTSFSWHPTRTDVMAISTTPGQVYIVRLPPLDKLSAAMDEPPAPGEWHLYEEPVLTHTLESWTVVISPSMSLPVLGQVDEGDVVFRVYSGGDDSMLRYRTCKWDKDNNFFADLPAIESRGHDAGVTAILPLFMADDGRELVVTGSYDEHIRLFAVPVFGKAVNLAESCLGGGVWRLNLINLKKEPKKGEYRWRASILASCMHAGARVVELRQTECGEYQFRVLVRFEEHKSMNYGSDITPDKWREKLPVVSTSFYDKLLCVWEIHRYII